MKNSKHYVLSWDQADVSCVRTYTLWRELCAQLKWCLDMGHKIVSITIE